MGDSRQHAAVERGAALRVLETLGGVPVAAVTEIRRQAGVYKQAVEALAEGRSDDGFELLESQGSIQIIADDAERDIQIATDYAAAKARGESVLVVSPTHAEADRVTGAIRNQLREAGQLGAEREFSQLVPRHLSETQRGDALNYAPGDVVQFVRSQPGHAAGRNLDDLFRDLCFHRVQTVQEFDTLLAGTLPVGTPVVTKLDITTVRDRPGVE